MSEINATTADIDLPPMLELAAQMLAHGHSDAEAGMAIGRHAKTVQRARRSDAAFAARVRELKAQRVDQAAAGLGALLDDAIAAVRRGLSSGRSADELRAAALVLDRFRLFRSDTEAAERIAELQQEIDALQAAVANLGRPEETPS